MEQPEETERNWYLRTAVAAHVTLVHVESWKMFILVHICLRFGSMCTTHMRHQQVKNKNQITTVGHRVWVSALLLRPFLICCSASYSIWRKPKWMKTALSRGAKGGDRSKEMQECLNSVYGERDRVLASMPSFTEWKTTNHEIEFFFQVIFFFFFVFRSQLTATAAFSL